MHVQKFQVVIILSVLFLTCFIVFPSSVFAATSYYVDPDYSGTVRNGTEQNPWKSLADSQNPTPWSAINTALGSNDVTVYFSARAAGSDTDQAASVGLQLNRTDTSANRLTLDGKSRYNASDSSPSWSNYSGSSRFNITVGIYAVNTNNDNSPYTHRNYITVRGFNLIATDQPVVIMNAGHFIFEENDLQTSVVAATPNRKTVGPAFIYQHRPLGDTNHANYDCCITVRNNNIHDTFSEAIYISGNGGDGGKGFGVPPGDTADTQTEDDVLIEGNTITNPGLRGGQGDGIDVKEGHTNLRIRNNTIDESLSLNNGNRCITVESADLIENNFLKNCTTNGINATAGYNGTHGRDRLVIRNNIVIAGPNSALKLDPSDATSPAYYWSNIKVQNNTFFKPSNTARDSVVIIGCNTNVSFTNNVVVGGTSTYQALQYFCSEATTFGTHDYNSYIVRSSNYSWVLQQSVKGYDKSAITTWEPHSITSEPLFISENSPYSADNFKVLGTSPTIGAGIAISPSFPDYTGITRPATWSIGAYEYSGGVTPPPTPLPPPPPAPTISSITTSLITTTGATISWTTDQSADTQVEYGLTSSYGANTTLNTSLTTSHSQSLSNLSSNTVYHYRVKSKNAGGTLTTSGDTTFTTTAVVPLPDTTPPTVSLTTPTTGSVVSGTTATISATASDNVAVSQVVFKLDSTTLATDTTSPYSTSWNTTLYTNGTHTVTAVATDSSGNTSQTQITVTVNNVTSTPVPGDFNLDHIVNSLDWSLMNSKWFSSDTTVDLNHDGVINTIDFSLLNANWGKTW